MCRRGAPGAGEPNASSSSTSHPKTAAAAAAARRPAAAAEAAADAAAAGIVATAPPRVNRATSGLEKRPGRGSRRRRRREAFSFFSFLFVPFFLSLLFRSLGFPLITTTIVFFLLSLPLLKLHLGIALLIYYTGALSGYIGEIIPSNENEDDPSVGRRRGLLAALAAWLLYCLLQGSPRMPLLRPHPAVWRLVHGKS